MFEHHRNEAGFAPLLVAVVIVVVAALGGSCYLIYKSHNKHSTTASVSARTASQKPNTTGGALSTQKTTTPPTTTAYFKISEWGVEAPYNGSDFTYSPVSGHSNEMWLTSQQLTNAAPQCSTGNAGMISRYLPSDTWPQIPGPEVTPMTVQQFLSQDFSASNSAKPHYAKVGNYDYIYSTPQNSCTTDSALVNQTTDTAGSLVDGLQAIPN